MSVTIDAPSIDTNNERRYADDPNRDPVVAIAPATRIPLVICNGSLCRARPIKIGRKVLATRCHVG